MNAIGRFLFTALAGAALLLWGLVLDGVIHARNPALVHTETVFSFQNPGHLLIFVGVGMIFLALVFLANVFLKPVAGAAPAGAVPAGADAPQVNAPQVDAPQVDAPPRLAEGTAPEASAAGQPARISPGIRRAIVGAGLAALIGLAGVAATSALPGIGTGLHAHAAAVSYSRDGLTLIHTEHEGLPSTAVSRFGVEASPTITELQKALEMETRVRAATAKYAHDLAAAKRDGYTLADVALEHLPELGVVHYTNPVLAHDDDFLNPEKPEVLIFAVNDVQKALLLGVMWLYPVGEHGPQFAGPLTQWHYHPKMRFCVDRSGVPLDFQPRGACPAGTTTQSPEMLHLWLIDNPNGMFSHHMDVTAAAQLLREQTD